MENWKYVEAYEKRKVVDAATVTLAKLTTDKDFVTAYGKLCEAVHFQDSSAPEGAANGKTANEKRKQIVDEVHFRLEKAGWHVHIFKNGSVHEADFGNGKCDYTSSDYLFGGFGMPEVHQVPFSDNWNTELTETELFNDNGSLRTKQETLNLLRQRIGRDAVNVDKMLEDGKITEETAEIVKAIMAAQNLTEIQEINEDARTFIAGSQEWTWRSNEVEAEEEAREYLEEGEGWRGAVKAEQTTQSLEEWINDILNMDGWQNELCGYDGQSYELESGIVYWRSN